MSFVLLVCLHTCLHVSISSGILLPLRRATTDHCACLASYPLNIIHFLESCICSQFWFSKHLRFPFFLSHLNRHHETMHIPKFSYWGSACSTKLFCHQGRRLHSAKIHLTIDAQFLIICSSSVIFLHSTSILLLILCSSFCTNR